MDKEFKNEFIKELKNVEVRLTKLLDDVHKEIRSLLNDVHQEMCSLRITIRRWTYIVPVISLSVAVLTFILVIILKKYGF